MRTYSLDCELLTSRPIDEVFAIFEDPYNLIRITPEWLNLKVTNTTPVTMRAGAEITYRIRWAGLPVGWKTLITQYAPPHLFVDEQVQGPYSLWRHRHTFVQLPGGVQVADHVDYALPLGWLGRAAHWTLIEEQLKAIFQYRQAALANMLGGSTQAVKDPVISAGQAY